MLTFKGIICDFVENNNVGIYIIHMDISVDRKPLIKQLSESLSIDPIIYPAVDGKSLVDNGYPTKCVSSTNTNVYYRKPGKIGCTLSHVYACKDAISKSYDYAVIFEDDCIFNNTLENLYKSLNDFKRLNIKWDMFNLGCEDLKKNESITDYYKVKNFYYTHSYIVNNTIMKELIEFNEAMYKNGMTCCADGIYSELLNNNNKLSAYTFNQSNKFFIQPPNNYSYALDKKR